MKRFVLFCLILTLVLPAVVFAQQGAAAVRDYVGLINQSYHPSIVSYFEKAKEEYLKRGDNDSAKIIDIILSGGFGSGFLFSDRGNFYVITNNHVISQAHEVSITFERTDGTKRKIENLKIIATDVENDIAILAFPPGERPLVTQGLTFVNRAVEEGEDVFSAGFPGLGMTPIWQFSRGMVSNASVRFPKSFDDETLMGPYIQHTAQIDEGNSGSPLLIAQRNAPSGYAVAGINTLSARRRQAANYAIPLSTFQPFINSALNPRPETFKAALDQRLESFVDGFKSNTASYTHISEYLSTVCIGENAEYAFEEMLSKASRTVVRTFFDKSREDLIGAMGIAVAWTIENSIRSGTAINVSIKEVTGSGEEYTVIFTVNNRDVSSVWIREYGNWRIRSFGTVAAGDASLIERRKKERETKEKLRLDSLFHVEAGYAHLFDKAPNAIYAGADIFNSMGVKMYYVDSDFWSLGMYFGRHFAIPAGNLGFMPYIRVGFDYFNDTGWDEYLKQDSMNIGFPVSGMAQAGLKVTSTYVPGLFIGAAFQFNFFSMMDSYDNQMKQAFAITAGYAF